MAGRPSIGPRQDVRVSADTEAQIVAWQTRWDLPGQSGKAEAHRRILAAGLAALEQGDTMTSYTVTYDVHTAGLADLALDYGQNARLADLIDETEGLGEAINEAITAKIQEHGVSTETGEWYGDWSAEAVIADILATRGLAL